ncbi:MAG TPA: YifB family Mg chelatase-like AAA ATPase [Firmicutes bacterium]|nr:YifB family Mg chelatase-like AAA ATPase [Bacillota bacterium]
MYRRLYSMGLQGMQAFIVTVETDISRGMPGFEIVGLPDNAVRESRDRVRPAVRNCGYEFPASRITINLAPADIRKSGPLYDLPVFLSILAATGQLAVSLDNMVFLGELALDGGVRAVNGVLPMVLAAKEAGFQKAFVPAANATEAGIVAGIEVFGIAHVDELIGFLTGIRKLSPVTTSIPAYSETGHLPDFSDVKGQKEAKRALEIAAAGGHNVLMLGSPGSGKSMLAKRLPSILPDMTWEEQIEITKIHSVAGLLTAEQPLVRSRPFRAPHHTVSAAGLTGGGVMPRPGEISLAHHGVLFLDELPEFPRNVLEILRQPIEDGKVTISRASGTITYPSSMMVIAAMNPCPCGYFGHPFRPCTCTDQQVSRYLAKVSGPLLDRLDLHIEVMPVEFESLSSTQQEESSAAVKARVDKARAIQLERYQTTGITCNAQLSSGQLEQFCQLTGRSRDILKSAFERLGLSARAYDRILKIARTIADLDHCETIGSSHIAEAIRYRNLDRKYWQHT